MRPLIPEIGPTRESAPPVKHAAPTQLLKIYRVVVKNNEARLEAVKVKPISGKTPVKSAILRLIMEENGKDSANPIPEGTKLLSLKVADGLATVDFSKEFRDKFSGGSEAEGMTVDAILRTLGQFPEVKQVQLLVEGKPLDTLGHLDLSKPLDVSGAGPNTGGEN
jgi:spore germination protein GerM